VSGASAVVAADKVATAWRLSLAVPSSEVSAAVQREIDTRLTFANPLDVGFNETPPIAGAIQAMRGADGFDTVIGVVTSLAHDPDVLAAELTKPADGLSPLVVTFLSAEDAMPSAHLQRLTDARIAVLPTPERAVAALDLLAPDLLTAQSVAGEHAPAPALIGIEAVADLVSAVDLRFAPWEIVGTADEAASVAETFGYPVVLKVAGRTLMHRSEAGGVAVGVTRQRMPEVFADLHRTATEHADAVMVQRQAEPGFELMLSVIDSPEFGPVAILRPGGVLAELMKEQVVLAASWSHRHRLDVLLGSTLGVVLDGYRGGRHYGLGAVVELADAACRVVHANDLAFLELNPVIVGEDGLAVVDAIAAFWPEPTQS
jgi:acyl-CoA synthetase (NDP forming)